MKSNVDVFETATKFSRFGIKVVLSKNPNKFSGLALNYRNLYKLGKSTKRLEKKMEDALLDESYVVVESPRNKNSKAYFTLLNLNEDGLENLKMVRFLCQHHNFLLSNALALVGGYINGNSAMSTVCNAFKNSKTDYLNSIASHLAKTRLRTYLQSSIVKFQFEKKHLDEIIQQIELSNI